MDIKDLVVETSSKLLVGYDSTLTDRPDIATIAGIIDKLKAAVFPGYFKGLSEAGPPHALLRSLIANIHTELSEEIKTVIRKQNVNKDVTLHANEISAALLEHLADIQQLLYKDAQAGFEGDPAAKSIDEVILTYPGFFAVFVYRIAHFLFLKKVPLIPRIMSEHAHCVTGIDIHPGAEIGEYFFIDHGTGVVIGETTIIGNHVKLYQGVTLGALSTKSGQKLAGQKRHPTIEDNVIIYSGASILGGDTVIGKDVVIGGNAFIIKSVSAKTIVKVLNPELQYKSSGRIESLGVLQPNAWFYEI